MKIRLKRVEVSQVVDPLGFLVEKAKPSKVLIESNSPEKPYQDLLLTEEIRLTS